MNPMDFNHNGHFDPQDAYIYDHIVNGEQCDKENNSGGNMNRGTTSGGLSYGGIMLILIIIGVVLKLALGC